MVGRAGLSCQNLCILPLCRPRWQRALPPGSIVSMNDGALKIIKTRISISKSMQTARRPSELQTDGALLPTASVGFSSGFANVCDVRIDAIVGHCRKSLLVVYWFALAVSLDDICRLGALVFGIGSCSLLLFFLFLHTSLYGWLLGWLRLFWLWVPDFPLEQLLVWHI